jgi:hypothetical protein
MGHTEDLAVDESVKTPQHLPLGNEPTQTIDLQGLFTDDVGQSGFFDLTDIASTSLGKLLDALPLPVLLIDQWFCIAYVNQSCEKLGFNCKGMKGSRFTDLLPNCNDATRDDAMRTKTMTLLEQVFADRKPKKAEAILESENHNIWARLHLRSVRLLSARHILAIMEDVTSERTHLKIVEKEDKQLRKALLEEQQRGRVVTRELCETKLELQRVTALHEETTRQLSACLERTRDGK